MRRAVVSVLGVLALAGTLLVAGAGPAAAATGTTCGNAERLDGSVVARVCVDWEAPWGDASAWAVWHPTVWNPPRGGSYNPVYAIFKPSHTGWYTGAIGDGKTWEFPTEDGGWDLPATITVRFEVATVDGYTQCVYIVPHSHSTSQGHCP